MKDQRLSTMEWLTVGMSLISFVAAAILWSTSSFGSKEIQQIQGLRIRSTENKTIEIAVNLKTLMEHEHLPYQEMQSAE